MVSIGILCIIDCIDNQHIVENVLSDFFKSKLSFSKQTIDTLLQISPNLVMECPSAERLAM